MKSSHKLLLGSMVFLLGLFIVGLFLLRSSVTSLLQEASLHSAYETIDVEPFHSLVIADKGQVRIKKARHFKLSVAQENGKLVKPGITNLNGMLKLASHSGTDSSKSAMPYRVKVQMPVLKSLKAGGDSQIFLEGFDNDSVEIVLNDGTSFTGKNNKFKNASFVTDGQVKLRFIDSITF